MDMSRLNCRTGLSYPDQFSRSATAIHAAGEIQTTRRHRRTGHGLSTQRQTGVCHRRVRMGCVQSRESDHLPSLSLRAYTRRRSMSKPHKKNRPPKHVLALPDLEQCKTAVLNTLTSKSGQRSYDRAITDFVDWYCLMCCLTELSSASGGLRMAGRPRRSIHMSTSRRCRLRTSDSQYHDILNASLISGSFFETSPGRWI